MVISFFYVKIQNYFQVKRPTLYISSSFLTLSFQLHSTLLLADPTRTTSPLHHLTNRITTIISTKTAITINITIIITTNITTSVITNITTTITTNITTILTPNIITTKITLLPLPLLSQPYCRYHYQHQYYHHHNITKTTKLSPIASSAPPKLYHHQNN